MLLHAYTTYVRLLLEYNTVIWSPSLKCDVTAVEKVQRRFKSAYLDSEISVMST